MKRIVLTYGLIAGAVVAAGMYVPPAIIGRMDYAHSEIVGYTTMVVAFLFIFVGVRRYRDTEAGGELSFGRAFAVGFGIALVTSCCYVASWELASHFLYPNFAQTYADHAVERARARGASPEAVAALTAQMRAFVVSYANPLYRIPMTFAEILPVGLVMALLAAATLRRSGARRAAASPAIAA